MKKSKWGRRIIRLAGLLFILLNGIACIHAYKFTHFSATAASKTSEQLSFVQKLGLALTGINNPRPVNKTVPRQPYQVLKIKSNKTLDAWLLQSDTAKGTVLLFHGYGGEKSSMLDKADIFLTAGFNTLLIDFMGAGGSEGVQTTIGFKEAEEVKDCLEYVHASGAKNIHLFGTSMGAVAILKAIDQYKIQPASIIIECPFGTMYQTVAARFKQQGVPALPMAPLLVFWGGLQNGFWAFGHNPEQYAKSVSCPTLLLYGEKDAKVSPQEIKTIYANLKGTKILRTYPLAAHENYLRKYKREWTADVTSFLQQNTRSLP